MKRVTLFLLVVFLFSGLWSETVGVLPVSGTNVKFSKEITAEMKTLWEEADSMELVSPGSAANSAAKRCKGNTACLKKAVKKSKGVSFVASFALKKFKMIITVYTKQGKFLGKKIVKEDSDIDAEDFAADVIAALGTLSGKLQVEEKDDAGDDDGGSSSKSLSASQKKNRMRQGFKAYKQGNAKSAQKSFKEAGDAGMASDSKKVDAGLTKASSMIKSGDYTAAIEKLMKLKGTDRQIRAKGYKMLAFIKETQKRNKYLKPKDSDFDKVDRVFGRIKKEIRKIATWKAKEISKIEGRFSGKSESQASITKKYEKQEKQARLNDKKEERKHQEKIEGTKTQLEGLDNKYRKKIKLLELKIEKLNRRVDEERPVDEVYGKEIKKDQQAVNKKYAKMKVQLKKNQKALKKKQLQALSAVKKKYGSQINKLKRDNKKSEGSINSLSKSIDKQTESFEKKEQMFRSKYDNSLSKFDSADQKDREVLEKSIQKKINKLNRSVDVYEKKLNKQADKIFKYDDQISKFTDGKQRKMQALQDKSENSKSKLESGFEAKRRKAEELAEKEYEKTQSKLAKGMEQIEKKLFALEDKYDNYEKRPDYKRIKKQQRAATKKLVKFEDGHDKFISKKTAPVDKQKRAKFKAIDKDTSGKRSAILKEIKAYKSKKLGEKKVEKQKLSGLKKGKKGFLAGIKKKIAIANSKNTKASKKIDRRAGQREKKFNAESKKRRGIFNKAVGVKKKQLKSAEKQISVNSKKLGKLQRILNAQMDKTKISHEKQMNSMMIANDKKTEQYEIATDKERMAVIGKYDKKMLAQKKKNIASAAQLEKKMKTLISQREKEAIRLRANINKLEKQTDSIAAKWEANAKKRRAKFNTKLKSSRKTEKKVLVQKKREISKIEAQYKTKLNKVIGEAVKSAKSSIHTKEFKVEREREFEASSYSKRIDAMLARAYSQKALKKLKGEDISGARANIFKALHADKNSGDAKKAKQRMNATIANLYQKAKKKVKDDPERAITMLKKLIRDLYPTDTYYLKGKALIEEIKVSD